MPNAVLVCGDDSYHVKEVGEDFSGLGLPETLGQEELQGGNRVCRDETFNRACLYMPQHGLGVIGERLSSCQDVENDVDIEKNPGHPCLAFR